MILNNAELRRNIWLDFTAQRMILTLLVIGLICYIFKPAFALACFFIFLWGTKSASECVIDEVNQNTWDFQRQSAQTPLEMSIGKLFGSTLFAWYGAGLSILFYLYEQTQNPSQISSIFRQFTQHHLQDLSVMREISYLVLGGMLTHALALILSLQVLAKVRRDNNIKSFRYFLIAVVLGSVFTAQIFAFSKAPAATISWHQLQFNLLNFVTGSLLIFVGWSLVAVYRSFSKELQYSQIPWIWLLFNFFCVVYFAGFIGTPNFQIDEIKQLKDINAVFQSAPTFTAFMTALLLGYAALLVDNLSYMQYKRLYTHATAERTREALSYTPLWTVSFVFVLCTGIIAMLNPPPLSDYIDSFSATVLVTTTIGFMVRDIALLHLIYLRQQSKMIGTFVLYLFLLYILIPSVCKLLHASHLIAAFLPSFGKHNFVAFSGLFAQLFLISLLLKTSLRKNQVP